MSAHTPSFPCSEAFRYLKAEWWRAAAGEWSGSSGRPPAWRVSRSCPLRLRTTTSADHRGDNMSRNAALGTALEHGAALAEAIIELDLGLVPAVPIQPEIPSEEFRTLRTRLEQLQATRAIQAVLVASPSRGDGKSFTAANLALAEAQLADNPTLLCDFDLRHPVQQRVFRLNRSPGISEYLAGKVELHEAMRRIGNSNLFVMPAGEPVINPLELLHVKRVRRLMNSLRNAFRWILLDSPGLLGASDANLLAALADGTLLVTRMGATTPDAMTRAIGSLGQDNILGIIANGANAG